MTDDTNPRARAIGALCELFLDRFADGADFADIEYAVIEEGHACMREAFGLALEALDARLLQTRPKDLKVHDVRSRTLATEIGDLTFSLRRYRDPSGLDVYPLADALDIPYGVRVSAGAVAFLQQAAAHISYAKAARLLARHGSTVAPATAMKCMREAGALCAEEDAAAAKALYVDGVVPDAECERACLCMEADGTFFHVQGAAKESTKRLEVKAMAAYEGKVAHGRKVRRRGCVHHAIVGDSDELWSEGVAAAGTRYDLSKIERVHLGADGERWCRDAERFLPRAQVTFHLDPFHINHAVMACFSDPKMAWNVIEVINDGGKEQAVALLRVCKEFGLANKRVDAVIAYLEGNIDAIAIDGPSLGTMESENQHLYGVRMDSFPCAWSPQGACDMARVISRKESGRSVPRMTRERSMGSRRRDARARKELAFYERQGTSASEVVQSAGSGYLPPHQADTRRIDAGKRYALYKGMGYLDRGL